MKNMNFLYKTMALPLLITLVFLGSCKKDELSSNELLVFVHGEYGTLDNSIVVPFVHTPLSVLGSTSVSVKASATRPVAADVSVTLTADTSLVKTFNQQNNTSFAALPSVNYKVVNSSKHKIAAGNQFSDSMQLEIVSPETLNNPQGYLLPLTISGIDGQDKGVRISSNQATVYIKITYAFNNVVNTQDTLLGSLAARTGWVVTVSNTTSGALGPAMIDGSNSTAWRSSNSSSAAKWASIDMKTQQTIKGFRLVPDYVSTGENATQITVSTSPDNITWTVQGIWKGTGPAASSSAVSPDTKGINFIAPVQAQYFRFDINSWVSGSRAGIGEVNVVQ